MNGFNKLKMYILCWWAYRRQNCDAGVECILKCTEQSYTSNCNTCWINVHFSSMLKEMYCCSDTIIKRNGIGMFWRQSITAPSKHISHKSSFPSGNFISFSLTALKPILQSCPPPIISSLQVHWFLLNQPALVAPSVY